MLAVAIEGEFAGAILRLDGLVLQLRSPKAFPPGRPLRLALTDCEPALALEGRSLGSKRAEDGSFELRLRLINLRRETREALEHAWASVERG